jgi:ATP-dependent Lon protease
MNPELRSKVLATFPSLAVDKREALQAGFELMPRFVTEFLIAAARARTGGIGTQEVRERIQQFSVDADRKGAFISRLMREGQARLIALLDVEPKPERNTHVGRISQLDGIELHIPERLVAGLPELLYGGLWGTCLLKYDTTGPKPVMSVEEFQPYQLTRPDMELFRSARSQFTLDEWVELMLTSAGYRAEAFPTARLKMIALARLIPLVQRNVNLVELGPRGTGKSYLLRNLSSRVYLLAGGKATPAVLLYDQNKRQVGIVGRKKVVVFDEIGSTQISDLSLVAALKDYMESGTISRGGKSLVSDCSLLFSGNLDLDADGQSPSRGYTHLFEVLPPKLGDTAIADRIHGFLPGWEMPKIADDVLADGVGLLSDYFGEVLGELRADLGFQDLIRSRLVLEGATTRDQNAVERMTAGLLKILYPDRRVEEAGLLACAQIACELRQRVHNQLVKMAPGEYRPKSIRFAGMEPLSAVDLTSERPLEEQDVEANQRAAVGKITILTVSERGGGDVGFVECAHVSGAKGLSLTGLRGEVLAQSVQAAYNALLNLGSQHGLTPARLAERKMSVHLVNIAVPKDGPSAGLAFALSMLSAATGRAVRAGIAVTGELSIHGNVTGVGGIAEKLTAAIQHGRKLAIIPAENAAELARLPGIVDQIQVRPVRSLAEAVALAFEEAQVSDVGA